MHTPSSSDDGKDRAVLNAFAGGLAGCISRIAIGPLDVIKVRFQVQLEPISSTNISKYSGLRQAFVTILREEGVQGLWRGTVPGLLLTVPYTAVQFVALEQVKGFANQHGMKGSPVWSPMVSCTSGALAGAAATVASYPFDLLRTTLAAQGEPKVYGSMWAAARGITQREGLKGLYRGMGITLLEIMPYAALQFGLYDGFNIMWSQARAEWHRWRPPPPAAPAAHPADTQVQHFVCGLGAGLLAKLATHPLDVAKKRFQVAGLPRSLRYGARVGPEVTSFSLWACLMQIWRTEGPMGLWKGSMPSIIKAAPASAITFTAYEAIIAWLLAATAVV